MSLITNLLVLYTLNLLIDVKIRGYYGRGKIVVNLGCNFSSHLLVWPFIQQGGLGNIGILAIYRCLYFFNKAISKESQFYNLLR